MNRGYSIVALDHPKKDNNIGAVMRAAYCFDSKMIVIAGNRYKRQPTDTPYAQRSIPTLQVQSVMDAVPYDCEPVAVDLLPGATELPNFTHPQRAFYIFGAEDRTLPAEIVSRCKHKIVIPTKTCLNLAMAVNIVLYDRTCKQQRA